MKLDVNKKQYVIVQSISGKLHILSSLFSIKENALKELEKRKQFHDEHLQDCIIKWEKENNVGPMELFEIKYEKVV